MNSILIEAVGVVAGLLVYGAMAFKHLVVIKALLLAGAIGFLTYGLILALPAIIIVNVIGICLGVYGLVSAVRYTRRKQSGGK